MEKKLKMLFDFQAFEHNAALDSLIEDTENRYIRELSDYDLTLVSAAGTGGLQTDNPPAFRSEQNEKDTRNRIF